LGWSKRKSCFPLSPLWCPPLPPAQASVFGHEKPVFPVFLGRTSFFFWYNQCRKPSITASSRPYGQNFVRDGLSHTSRATPWVHGKGAPIPYVGFYGCLKGFNPSNLVCVWNLGVLQVSKELDFMPPLLFQPSLAPRRGPHGCPTWESLGRHLAVHAQGLVVVGVGGG